jgi:predicted NAD/FAD-binding protein
MVAAVWSAPPGRALEMPAVFVIDFFRNHGLLGLRRHRWRTVVGGSATYVDALVDRAGVAVRRETPVLGVRRDERGVTIVTASGTEHRYDGVVLAVSAVGALEVLDAPSGDEQRLLEVFRTTRNETVLHTDARFLPRRRGDRSAWNYQDLDCNQSGGGPTLTYSANRLQRLRSPHEYCITLNRTAAIDEGSIVSSFTDEHPRVTIASNGARPRLHRLNGRERTAFAGAWQGNGFHEDGLASGLRAAAALERSLT